MKITGVWALLAALLLLITTVKGESEKADWYKDKEKLSNTTESLALQYNDASKGVYHSAVTGLLHFLTVALRSSVCENCFELDGFVIMGAIIGDVVITGCVSLLIYKWAKNKNSNAKPTTPGKNTNRCKYCLCLYKPTFQYRGEKHNYCRLPVGFVIGTNGSDV
uniref:CD3 gamma/delta subunit Ig-like domain-containing protein n=1 Tax=Myripristis murdjan TaxID=586833 RepID=A0A667YV85_9TELE